MKITKKQLQTDVSDTTILKDLMTSYEEIAAIRMQRIREQVVKSRDFHEILSHYFHEIRTTHSLFEEEQKTKEKPETNEQELIILLSDNKGLYGDILHKTTDAFIAYAVEHQDAKLLCIGTLPQEKLKTVLPDRDLTVVSLPETKAVVQNLADVLALITSYQKVSVFHGKFMSLINQEPQASDLTGQEEPSETTQGVTKEYLLEPSHDKLKEFFQKEIMTVLFDQAVLEGTLAKVASRVMTLEKATDEASRRLKRLERLSRMLRSEKQNKEQITYLAGLSLWQIQ